MADGDTGGVRKAFCWSLQWKGSCSLPGGKQAVATLQHEQIHLVTSDRWITFLEELQRCAEGGGGGGGVQAPFLWDCPTASWQARPGASVIRWKWRTHKIIHKKRSRSDALCEIRMIRDKEYQAENKWSHMLLLPGVCCWWWWWWVQGPKSPPEMSVCSSAVLSSAHAACLAAGADMLPSAGSRPAETLTTPGIKPKMLN